MVHLAMIHLSVLKRLCVVLMGLIVTFQHTALSGARETAMSPRYPTGVVAGLASHHGSIGTCDSSWHAPPCHPWETADKRHSSVGKTTSITLQLSLKFAVQSGSRSGHIA